jgi:hypothetical protein
MKFFKGCLYALPISLCLWVILILAIVGLVHLIGG